MTYLDHLKATNARRSRPDRTPMTDTTELTNELKQTVTRLLTLAQQRAEIEAEEAHLKKTLRAHLTIGTPATVNGQPVVTLTPNRRFNADLAKQTLPESLLALCTVTKVDSAAAKKTLPPALYEQCMAEVGEPVVRFL